MTASQDPYRFKTLLNHFFGDTAYSTETALKRLLVRTLFSLVLIVAAHTSNAQVNTNPTGGLTIKTLQVTDTGWVFVEFVESNTEITNNCEAASTLFGSFPKVLWMAPNQAGGKDVYALLLALHLAGRPVSGLTLYDMGNYCALYAVRTAQ